MGYLRARESPDGGFCFYRSQFVDEPNLLDTYHAVSALRLAGACPQYPEALLGYLDTAPDYGVSYLYYQAFALEALGQADRLSPGRRGAIADLRIGPPDLTSAVGLSAWLQDARQAVLLKTRFTVPFDPAPAMALLDQARSGGVFGQKPNLLDSYLGLDALAALGHRHPSTEILCFVDALQTPTFGFCFGPHAAMPRLDVLHAGVKCCSLLGLPVRYPGAALKFALACQTGDGSFARAPFALPDIEMTHLALEVICGLSSDPGGCAGT